MAELSTSNRAETDGESVVVLAERIASVLGPAMRDLEGRIESASCSQAVLAGNIDRLAGELDKLLEITPTPLVLQPASQLSRLRKRISSLAASLVVIQGRVSHMNQAVSRNGVFDAPDLNH